MVQQIQISIIMHHGIGKLVVVKVHQIHDGSININLHISNTTAGFSIVFIHRHRKYATVGHGLGVAPNVVIIKKL